VSPGALTTLSLLGVLVLALLVLLAVVIGRSAKHRDTQIPCSTTEHDALWWRKNTDTDTDPRGES